MILFSSEIFVAFTLVFFVVVIAPSIGDFIDRDSL